LEYPEKNAAAREEQWLALELEERSNKARAEMDATRLLREHFPDGADRASVDKVIVVKTYACAVTRQAAERLGLEHESTHALLTPDGRDPSPCRWIVVGKSRSAVFAKIFEIIRDALRSHKEQRRQNRKEPKSRIEKLLAG
jgi:anti-sigma factor ChrR (cupin superfamily)